MACGVRAQRYGEGEVKSAMGAYCRIPQKLFKFPAGSLEGTWGAPSSWRLASPWIPRWRRRDRVRRPASCDCVRRRNSLERWDKRCKWLDTTAVSSWRQPGEQQQQQKPPHRWHPLVHLIYTSRCEPLTRSRNFVWRSLRWRSSMIAYWMQRML